MRLFVPYATPPSWFVYPFAPVRIFKYLYQKPASGGGMAMAKK
jgi:hypothetical protein